MTQHGKKPAHFTHRAFSGAMAHQVGFCDVRKYGRHPARSELVYRNNATGDYFYIRPSGSPVRVLPERVRFRFHLVSAVGGFIERLPPGVQQMIDCILYADTEISAWVAQLVGAALATKEITPAAAKRAVHSLFGKLPDEERQYSGLTRLVHEIVVGSREATEDWLEPRHVFPLVESLLGCYEVMHDILLHTFEFSFPSVKPEGWGPECWAELLWQFAKDHPKDLTRAVKDLLKNSYSLFERNHETTFGEHVLFFIEEYNGDLPVEVEELHESIRKQIREASSDGDRDEGGEDEDLGRRRYEW